MLRKLIFVVFFIAPLPAIELPAQGGSDNPYSWQDKIGFGGNVGLRFGDITYIELSPVVGYRVASFLMPGIGASYRYISYRYSNYGSYGNHVAGGSVWMRAYVAPMIFGYAEYEILNGEWDPYYQPDLRSNIFTTFVGGGYSQGIGRNSSYLLVLFATNQDGNSIYWNPVIRVGFMVGGSGE